MSQQQNTQIQKALNYIRNVALKQNTEEQQQTLTLLLSAVSSHLRIMLNPPKPIEKKQQSLKYANLRHYHLQVLMRQNNKTQIHSSKSAKLTLHKI